MHRNFHRLLLLLIAFCSFGFGQVAYQLSPTPIFQFTNANGVPLAGGFLYTYAAGSTTPQATYKDNAGTANSNPIVLDAGGYATIYIGQLSYKYCLYNSAMVQQWGGACRDNIQNFSQILLTSANVWAAVQTFQSFINFLGGTSDTTAAEGNIFYRTDLHRIRWYDAGSSSWHSVTGDDDTAILTGKSYDTAGAGNVFKINGTQISAVTGTGSTVLATSPALVTPSIGGETITKSPRAMWGNFIPVTTSIVGVSQMMIDQPITVTRIYARMGTAPVTCATAAIVTVTDGVTPINLTLANAVATDDSGAITQNYAAAAALQVNVSVAAAGCATPPANVMVTVQYRMQ